MATVWRAQCTMPSYLTPPAKSTDSVMRVRTVSIGYVAAI
jgi:hypothetical protein